MKSKRVFKFLIFAILLVVYFFGILMVFNVVETKADAKVVYAMGVDAKEVQEKLADYGYYNGAINGLFDDATVGTIKRFQADNG